MNNFRVFRPARVAGPPAKALPAASACSPPPLVGLPLSVPDPAHHRHHGCQKQRRKCARAPGACKETGTCVRRLSMSLSSTCSISGRLASESQELPEATAAGSHGCRPVPSFYSVASATTACQPPLDTRSAVPCSAAELMPIGRSPATVARSGAPRTARGAEPARRREQHATSSAGTGSHQGHGVAALAHSRQKKGVTTSNSLSWFSRALCVPRAFIHFWMQNRLLLQVC